LGCARRSCRVSLNPSTRRSPTAWAWASRSAARLSKPMVGGCGRRGASRGVLCFSLRSPRLQADRDHVDVPLWPLATDRIFMADGRFGCEADMAGPATGSTRSLVVESECDAVI